MHSEAWRPVAYVSMQDAKPVISTLDRLGWIVIPQPSGFHLIRAISGVIEGDRPWLRPSLLVTDVRARGCSGITIAQGLRDLGVSIPIVLVAAPGDELPITADDRTHIVDGVSAAVRVLEVAGANAVLDASPGPSDGSRPIRDRVPPRS